MRNITVLDQDAAHAAPDATQFAADLQWAVEKGARLERLDVQAQAAAVQDHPAAAAALAQHGTSALPLVLLDGDVVLQGRYPSRKELAGWAGIVVGAAFRLDEACGASGCCC